MASNPPKSPPTWRQPPYFLLFLIRTSTWMSKLLFRLLPWFLVGIVLVNIGAAFAESGTFALSNFLHLPVLIFVRTYPILSAAIGIATLSLAAVGFYSQRIAERWRSQLEEVKREVQRLAEEDAGSIVASEATLSSGSEVLKAEEDVASSGTTPEDRVARLEAEVARLRTRMAELEQRRTLTVTQPQLSPDPSASSSVSPDLWLGRAANIAQVLQSLPVIAAIIIALIALFIHH